MKIRFPYDPKKGLAMLQYLLNRVGGKYNYMALLKLAFFADRYHVRNYARPVSLDEYYALKLGPIPSHLTDIITNEEFFEENFHFETKHNVELKNYDIDLDQFSQSDIEAMEFAIKNFADLGQKSEFFIANLTHAYPEWEKYKQRFDSTPHGREDMDYADFLKNADPNHTEFQKLNFNDPFPPLSEEERQDLVEEMTERTLAFT